MTLHRDTINPLTCDYASFVHKLAKPMPTLVSDLHHMSTGIMGEVTELVVALMKNDTRNILEELGDGIFYITGICNFLGTDVQSCLFDAGSLIGDDTQLSQYEVLSPSMLIVSAGDLLDFTKKLWVYNKELDEAALEKLRGLIGRVAYYYNEVRESLGYPDLIYVQEQNRVKLLRRYEGGKYSDKAAQARADKAPGE